MTYALPSPGPEQAGTPDSEPATGLGLKPVQATEPGPVRADEPPLEPVSPTDRAGRAGLQTGRTDRKGRPGRTGRAVARAAGMAGRWRAGLVARFRLSTQAWDAVFAVALFLASTAALRRPLAHDTAVLLPVHTVLVLPLIWRRRAPLLVFFCMAGAALAQWIGDVQIPTDVTLLLALYAVAAYGTRRQTLVAFAVLEAGIALAAARWSTHDRGLGMFVSLSAMSIAATVIGLNMRSRRDRLASLEDRAVRLERERDQQARLAVAGERARIAREMHDIVTHNLSVMVALADGAVFAQQRTPERATAAMRQVSATGRQAITDMRRFLGVLRDDEPDALRHPMPGIGQVAALVEQVRAAGLPTRWGLTGDPAPVPAAAQLTVYRLVQEALTNTLKHAPAGTRAQVRIGCAPDAVTVTVTDDGAGTAAPGPSTGHGLPGMRERAAAYGGRLTAGPLPGGGWQVAAVLTLTPPEPL